MSPATFTTGSCLVDADHVSFDNFELNSSGEQVAALYRMSPSFDASTPRARRLVPEPGFQDDAISAMAQDDRRSFIALAHGTILRILK